MSDREQYRRDRYISNHGSVWDWEKPKERLKYSNFLKLYNSFDNDKLNDNKVYYAIPGDWKCGGKDVDTMFRDFSDSYSLDEKCIKLWTAESPVYPYLTQSLYEDDKKALDRMMPIIKGINKYLVTPTDKEYICYRGSKMSKKMWNYYKAGNEYRAPACCAMSQEKATADKFKDTYYIMFRIPKNCWNARPIASNLSPFDEQEILTPPYTAFKVLKKWEGLKELEVQILDNKQVAEYCHSAFV